VYCWWTTGGHAWRTWGLRRNSEDNSGDCEKRLDLGKQKTMVALGDRARRRISQRKRAGSTGRTVRNVKGSERRELAHKPGLPGNDVHHNSQSRRFGSNAECELGAHESRWLTRHLARDIQLPAGSSPTGSGYCRAEQYCCSDRQRWTSSRPYDAPAVDGCDPRPRGVDRFVDVALARNLVDRGQFDERVPFSLGTLNCDAMVEALHPDAA
jgi:hypothetical protein